MTDESQTNPIVTRAEAIAWLATARADLCRVQATERLLVAHLRGLEAIETLRARILELELASKEKKP